MKINLNVSKDGINEEQFKDVEFSNLDNKSDEVVKKEVEQYCHSALESLITKDILEMKVQVPHLPLATLIRTYFEAIQAKYPDIAERVHKLMYDPCGSVVVLIDDLIGVLQSIKPILRKFNQGDYDNLRAIVFENCQLDDPNSI